MIERHGGAVRHYEMGVRIGELPARPDFDGVLSWGFVDNRPFLCCMKGYGLCLWWLGRFEDAQRVFTSVLWMKPGDRHGTVGGGASWRSDEGDADEGAKP